MRIRSKLIMVLCLGLSLLICTGCGRKLPPLPPGPGDPVEIVSIEFLKDGTVEARARCNIDGGTVTLLGKPKGLCPSCTDDLLKKDETVVEKKGKIVMKDAFPESDYMVYRFGFEKETVHFMTGPRIVKK